MTKYYAFKVAALFVALNFFSYFYPFDLWSLATQITHHTHVAHTFNTDFAQEIAIPSSLQPDFKNFLSSSVKNNNYQCTQNYSKPNGNWTKHDFAHYFEQLFCNDTKLATINRSYGQSFCQLTALGQQEVLKQLPLYAYKGFRDYVVTLPAYPQFIRNLCHQLDNNKFCRIINKQLARSPAFQTSNQWQHARIPTSLFYQLRAALPPEHYTQKQITTAQMEVQHTYANKEVFAQHAQQVLQDPYVSKQHQDFAQQLYADTKTVDGTCTTQQHEVSSQAIDCAQKHQLTAQHLQTTYGSQVMHTVHGALLENLDEATTAQKSNALAADIANSCVVAMEYNHAGKVYEALTIADFCRVALDYTKKFGYFATECTKGAGLGAYDAVNNIYRMAKHPIQTAHEITMGFAHLSGYLFKVLYHLGGIKAEMDGDCFGTADNQLEEFAMQTGAIGAAIGRKLVGMSTRDWVRCAVSNCTEIWLSSKLISTIGSFCKKTAKLYTITVHHIKETVQAVEITNPVAAGLPKLEGLKPNKIQLFLNQATQRVNNVLKVRNMNEFFKTEFGKFLKKNSVKTNRRYDGQTIYKVINKINQSSIKKGDYFYLDGLHFDHIEVFNKGKVAKLVLNLDGSINKQKTWSIIGRTLDI